MIFFHDVILVIELVATGLLAIIQWAVVSPVAGVMQAKIAAIFTKTITDIG
ncbi:hypothetical protein SAMN05216334_105134 [Nitrosomonas ureae]|uniref:Uncharacterized protein n=1 Tax=Nitrosomonas ureae TaxID=44577 RepID=A0A1H5TTZ1_9PROT|nr:hypothetical protein SAMN05216334_105134 [Nitrosomonas ureae]